MTIIFKRQSLLIGIVILVVLAFILSQVFSGHWILPQYFKLTFVYVRYYGLCLAFGVMAAYFLAQRRSEKYAINFQKAENFILLLIIVGFIGARLYHVLSSASYYASHPAQIVEVWRGGLSIYGALLGGILLVIFSRNYILKFVSSKWTALDWLAPSLLIGQIIGRFGNMFNYELYGYPTNLPWRMFVPVRFRSLEYFQFSFFHPLFLYEILFNSIILYFLLRGTFKIFKTPGSLFLTYVLLYNAERFFLEFLRIDSTFLGNVRINAVVSAVLVVSSLIVLKYRYTHDSVS